MGKLLILVDKIGTKKQRFVQEIIDRIGKENKVVLAEFSDLAFEIEEGKIEVLLNGQEPLRNFDFVYFRRATGTINIAGAVAISLDFLGIGYTDSSYGNLGRAGDKFTSLIRLAGEGLPVIPTYFCLNSKIITNYKNIVGKLGLPFVAKDLCRQRGVGVTLIKQKQDLLDLIKKHPSEQLLFQKFSRAKAEYRILVLENTIGAFEEKIRQDMTDFRANVSLGAKEKFLKIKDIPKEIRELSIKSGRVLGIEIGGVDVLIDEKGKPWLIEVNRGPGITYDDLDSPEMENISKYFKRKISQKHD